MFEKFNAKKAKMFGELVKNCHRACAKKKFRC
jgi:hypothetical protein